MKAVGITCGIGSMLVGARAAGFEVVGNVEWRKYYHATDELGRNTFKENFPKAKLHYSLDEMTTAEIERFFGVDLALGHPECGNFSQLSAMNPCKTNDPADIPLFVDIVAKLRPKFFVMDDLPKSFIAFPMSEYAARLPDYDLFPEWISNYHYGNIQKNRRRMFMLGAMKSERWAFQPGEFSHAKTVADLIGWLPEPGPSANVPNHDEHVMDVAAGRGLHLVSLGRGARGTFQDVADYLRDKPSGHIIRYVSEDGSIKGKPGSYKGNWEGPCHVLDGGSYAIHHHRCTPYTIRERAIIQGFPDDFVFYGTLRDERGRWNHDKNVHMVKQTGKAMPVQFCEYVSRQIAAHVRGQPFECSRERLIPPNEFVDQAKRWFCENVGYADQGNACSNCWLYRSCTIRQRKYQIGEPASNGQTDLVDPGVVALPLKPPPPPKVRRASRKRFSDEAVQEELLTWQPATKSTSSKGTDPQTITAAATTASRSLASSARRTTRTTRGSSGGNTTTRARAAKADT